jgi:hypothetical protein
MNARVGSWQGNAGNWEWDTFIPIVFATGQISHRPDFVRRQCFTDRAHARIEIEPHFALKSVGFEGR